MARAAPILPAEPQPCFFFKLPQELQDEIFALAYPRNGRISATIKRHTTSARIKRKMLRADRRLSSYKVNKFMISKAWFVGAAKAYMSAQTWVMTVDLMSVIEKQPTGLFSTFVARVEVDMSAFPVSFDLGLFASWEGLKYLCLVLIKRNFNDMGGKYIWLEVWCAADFEKLAITAALKQIKGLKQLTVSDKTSWLLRLPEREVLRRNQKAFEEYIQPFVTMARVDSSAADKVKWCPSGRRSLYRGSMVCFGRPDSSADIADSDIPETGGLAGFPQTMHSTAE
ncbi:hypothetical protein LTR08_007956 [Meristemomyces frigidus]|nr:hypothetical protein LTR08_007956 [Meristemomyces frigidus]